MSLAMGTVEDMRIVYRIELDHLRAGSHHDTDSWEFEAAYARYRKRGFNKHEAFEHAMCYTRNLREQRQRRCSHDTGYEDWKARA